MKYQITFLFTVLFVFSNCDSAPDVHESLRTLANEEFDDMADEELAAMKSEDASTK